MSLLHPDWRSESLTLFLPSPSCWQQTWLQTGDPRMWLISILGVEVDPKGQRIQVYPFYNVNEVYCLSPPPFWSEVCVWKINQTESVFTDRPSQCCAVSLSISLIRLGLFCLIILIPHEFPWSWSSTQSLTEAEDWPGATHGMVFSWGKLVQKSPGHPARTWPNEKPGIFTVGWSSYCPW